MAESPLAIQPQISQSPSSDHQSKHPNPIAAACQNGFLQAAVSKTLRRSAVPCSRTRYRRSVSDTALVLTIPDSFKGAKIRPETCCGGTFLVVARFFVNLTGRHF